MHTLALALTLGLAAVATTGCSVARNQQSAGGYVDDAAITTKVKSSFATDPTVSAMAIKVETLNGEVLLSGFAKSEAERNQAAELARNIAGVKLVRNAIAVR
ncbi:transporter [Comamonas serinivorans]|uniref:Transporter n=2 Tax=Comamonas serinivorans TaxID=1082851 RepID=A0A1Y0EPU3_9BURK|nr:transporter [Comamonas serinivorans]